MDCQYANSCTPTHTLPMTGFEITALLVLAVVVIAAAVAIRLAARRA